ncbi:MAG TPA: phage tail assembly chaperone [Alphaproteobacteria bacterium]|nr:phage tail assembly chaperone [Alphaproteobacteria bacterium]HAJ48522.1 phage tail assembly chaperone [Alphaproteobacteria bacterium]
MTTRPGAFPWRQWMRDAARQFHVPPTEFWSLSLREWRTLTAPDEAPGLGQDELDQLMRRYPDVPR